jgi:hypothetical protein
MKHYRAIVSGGMAAVDDQESLVTYDFAGQLMLISAGLGWGYVPVSGAGSAGKRRADRKRWPLIYPRIGHGLAGMKTPPDSLAHGGAAKF